MTLIGILLAGGAMFLLTVGVSFNVSVRLAALERGLNAIVRHRPQGSVVPDVIVRARQAWNLRHPHLHSLERDAAALRRAGSHMQPLTWALIRAGSLVVAVAFMPLSIVLGLVLVLVALGLPPLWLTSRQSQRKQRMERELPASLLALSNALKSGLSLGQAVSALAAEVPPPLGDLFRDIQQQSAVGVAVEQAMEEVSTSTGIEEFHLLATAVSIQRQSGGNLSAIIESVASIVAEKLKMRERVRALTAEPRLSAWVLSLLPFGVGSFMFVIDRSFMLPLITTTVGNAIIGAAVVMDVIGAIFIRAVIRVE